MLRREQGDAAPAVPGVMSADADSLFDLLIVGSGPIGSTYARLVRNRLPYVRILMVEAGPQIGDRLGMHVRNIADPEARRAAQQLSEGPTRDPEALAEKTKAEAAVAAIDRVLVRPGIFYAEPRSAATLEPSTLALGAMASNVGGMGSHWTSACPHPSRPERIGWIAEGEWEAALAVARRLLAVSARTFPRTRQGEAILAGLRHAYPELPVGRRPQPMPLACRTLPDGSRYWTGSDVVLGDLPDRPRFELRSSTLCRAIVHDGAHASGALLEDLRSGETYEISTRSVVVAGDSLRTPQLLWASGIRPPALGRFLNDHIQSIIAVRLDDELVRRVAERAPDLTDARRSDNDMIVGVFWVPFSAEHPFHGQVMHLDLAPIEIAPSAERSAQVVGLGWFAPKDIRPEDRVCFSDEERDGYGMPAISTRYELTERDREAIEAAHADILRAAASLGELMPDTPEPKLLPPGASLHYQGTVRIGQTDDGASVCDADLRVWGFDNLFVGGNGTIPTPTAGNPTLSSVALAARASAAVTQVIA
jgi:pyranose oxidase